MKKAKILLSAIAMAAVMTTNTFAAINGYSDDYSGGYSVILSRPDYTEINGVRCVRAAGFFHAFPLNVSHTWDPNTKSLDIYVRDYTAGVQHYKFVVGKSYVDYSRGDNMGNTVSVYDSGTVYCSTPIAVVNGSVYVDADAIEAVTNMGYKVKNDVMGFATYY